MLVFLKARSLRSLTHLPLTEIDCSWSGPPHIFDLGFLLCFFAPQWWTLIIIIVVFDDATRLLIASREAAGLSEA